MAYLKIAGRYVLYSRTETANVPKSELVALAFPVSESQVVGNSCHIDDWVFHTWIVGVIVLFTKNTCVTLLGGR